MTVENATPAMTTLQQLSATSGRRVRALQRACVRLGIAKTGVQYLLTDKQAAAVVAACHDGPGCPLFFNKPIKRRTRTKS